jgi:RNA-splicing ligase RtcB
MSCSCAGGVGSEGSLRLNVADMDRLLMQGTAFLEDKGLSWPEDRDVTEEHVRLLGS